MTITEEDARRIAREDARRAYRDLSPYSIEVAREDGDWRVDFELADELTLGGGPHYVISAETGEILSKRYEQ